MPNNEIYQLVLLAFQEVVSASGKTDDPFCLIMLRSCLEELRKIFSDTSYNIQLSLHHMQAIQAAANLLCRVLAAVQLSWPKKFLKAVCGLTGNTQRNKITQYLWCSVDKKIDPDLSSEAANQLLQDIRTILEDIHNLCPGVVDIPAQSQAVVTDIQSSLALLRKATKNVTSLQPFLAEEAIQLQMIKIVFIEQVTTKLFKASRSKDTLQLRPFLSAEAVNASLEKGVTPLHMSVYGGANVVKCFLEAGAALDAQDVQGWTTLHRAAYRKDVKTVQLLIEWGADVTIKNEIGKTALQLCQSNIEDRNAAGPGAKCLTLLESAFYERIVISQKNVSHILSL